MRFTLIHPSRGRATRAKETFDYWMRCHSGLTEVEHILSLDLSDAQNTLYTTLFSSSKVIINDNNCVVQATNHAAKIATGDVLIYLSDDFECPQNWDTLIYNEMIFQSAKGSWLLKVDDLLQRFEADVLTIPIMSRELHDRLGYFFHPEYKSMFCDQHLYWICKNNGFLLFAPNLKFPHLHYTNSKAPMDKTYKDSAANWDQGKALYYKHRQEGFLL